MVHLTLLNIFIIFYCKCVCFLARPSSPINTQIEMDVTSRQNSLSFESSANYQSTNGIHVQNVRKLSV